MKKRDYNKDLRKKLKELESLRGKISQKKSTDLEESIAIIKNYLIETTYVEESIEQTLFDEYQNLIDSHNMWGLCEILAKYRDDEIPNFSYPDLVLSDDELLGLVHDFFKNATSKEIYEKFLGLLKQGENIYFVNRKRSLTFYADSMYLPFDESFYARMEKKNEFADISTMSHEFGHGIQFSTNYNGCLLTSLYAFHEIVSTFFELLCTEYYTNDKTLGKKAIASNYEFWDVTRENAFELFRELDILKSIKSHSSSDAKSIRKSINFFVKHSDIKVLTEIMEIQPSNDFVYIIGYLFAVELYLIYEKDHDYAFYILKKILAIDLRKDAISYLNEIIKLGIVPTRSLDSFETHLKRELARL